MEIPKIKTENTNLEIVNSNAKYNLYIETYGCQMNVNDSEIVVSILQKENYKTTENISEADLILINTCSIRDNAEQRIKSRLFIFKKEKKRKPGLIIGVIGCMAERLKHKLLEEEKLIDLVVGPDAYRDLPKLLQQINGGQKAINVLLSQEETYAEISPVRYATNGVSAFISIMRGCDNMCSYCVVPFTRGRERSRDVNSILREAGELVDNNFKEITLLGQNVDKYNFTDEFGTNYNFSNLLKIVAENYPNTRIRFSTSYPQDMTDEVLTIMASHSNICKHIHLPIQSGSSKILELMKRGYSREWYLHRIDAIKRIIPDCSITTDIICGFCDETDHDHNETLSAMNLANYDYAFMFKYSERPNTYAQRKLNDNVPEHIKTERLTEVIALQQILSNKNNSAKVGKIYEVLIESVSKKSINDFMGRSSQNITIVFPRKNYNIGDFVNVKIIKNTSATLIGEIIDNS